MDAPKTTTTTKSPVFWAHGKRASELKFGKEPQDCNKVGHSFVLQMDQNKTPHEGRRVCVNCGTILPTPAILLRLSWVAVEPSLEIYNSMYPRPLYNIPQEKILQWIEEEQQKLKDYMDWRKHLADEAKAAKTMKPTTYEDQKK